jgi:tetratricopeptide (TPR) repeat protein
MKKKRIFSRLLTSMAVAACLGTVAAVSLPAVNAADDFAKGCELYNARNYTQAEPIFSETVRKFPNFWPGHYYLAHTLLAEGKRAAAKAEYEAVLGCKPAPGADVSGACQKVLATLGSGVATGSSASAASSAGGAGQAGEDGEKGETLNANQKANQDQISRLNQEMNAKLDALRAEMKEKIAEGENTANTLYKFPDGTVRTSMTPEQEAAIHKEYADKMHQVQEEYRNRISHIK